MYEWCGNDADDHFLARGGWGFYVGEAHSQNAYDRIYGTCQTAQAGELLAFRHALRVASQLASLVACGPR